ncbi:MAG: hypothetical protein JXA69_03520, partial [Phycisphaerae bacterium]|nr:hypothetical protein [Phycisphaerae bacterium]
MMRGNNLVLRIFLPLASAGIFAWAGEEPATSAPAIDQMEFAQLRILQMSVSEARLPARVEDRQGTTLVERAIDDYVAKGMPASVFERGTLRQVALQYAKRKLVGVPADFRNVVAQQLRRRYGLTGEDLYSLFPPRTDDVTGMLQEYQQTNDSVRRQALVDAITAAPVTADIVAMVREANKSASGKIAFFDTLRILQSDWSQAGRTYLMEMLLETQDVSEQKAILSALDARFEVDAEKLRVAAEGTENDGVLDAIFSVAEHAWQAGDPGARAFLEGQIRHGVGSCRRRAMQVLASPSGFRDIAAISAMHEAIQAEGDPARRAGMVRAMQQRAGRKETSELLWRLLETDPAVEVRIAAIETISLFVPPPDAAGLGRPSDAERLQAAVGPNAPQALQDALAAKLQEYETAEDEWRVRQERHQEELREYRAKILGETEARQPEATVSTSRPSLSSASRMSFHARARGFSEGL